MYQGYWKDIDVLLKKLDSLDKSLGNLLKKVEGLDARIEALETDQRQYKFRINKLWDIAGRGLHVRNVRSDIERVHKMYQSAIERVNVAATVAWALRSPGFCEKVGVSTNEVLPIITAAVEAFELSDGWWRGIGEEELSVSVARFKKIAKEGLPKEVEVTGGPGALTLDEQRRLEFMRNLERLLGHTAPDEEEVET